jgi:hypothetical protein
MTLSTEIVQKERSGALAHPALSGGKWNNFDGDVSDILIPKLLVGQATSKLVQEEKVNFGQVWRSTTGQVLGGKGKAFEVIPLFHFKNWIISEKVAGRFTFRGVEPFTAENRDKPWVWTETRDGKTTEWKREQALNFYVLLPADIAADQAARKAFQESGELPDTEASLLPCLLQFKSTAFKSGKIIVTHFAKAADFGVPPFVNKFRIDTEKLTGDQTAWFVLKAEPAGKTPPEYLETCAKWRAIVEKQNVKVDDSDLTADADAAPGGHADDVPPPPEMF